MDGAYVYFVKKGDRIKIGTTENLNTRLIQLRIDHGEIEVLGIMEGHYKLEQELHSRFKPFMAQSKDGRNCTNDWFHEHNELLQFISENTKPYQNKKIGLRGELRTRLIREKTQTVASSISQTMAKKLDKLSARRGIPKSEIIREAIEFYFEFHNESRLEESGDNQ